MISGSEVYTKTSSYICNSGFRRSILRRIDMVLTDTCCTLGPYFKIHEGKLDEFRSLGEQLVERSKAESKCMYYGFSFNGMQAHCREGYVDAEGVVTHLENVSSLLEQIFKVADITRLEVHAPGAEADKLRQPLSGLNPEFYIMEMGFRR
jgi:quinol monooxygenase YgiN